MRIIFRKISDDRHALAIMRDELAPERGEPREEVECETRSYLTHDLLHFAVEREAALQDGFWGTLASGVTLARMNDRARPLPSRDAEQLAAIEQIVGALSETLKGRTPADLVAAIRRFIASAGQAPPGWLTEQVVVGVNERMRQLLGQWRATPFRGEMTLDW